MNFWEKLPAQFLCLAPMADVTDQAFRRMFAKYGKPDVTWTEFVSADGLCSPGREHLLPDLGYTEAERPIVAQLFTSHPEKMYEAAKLARELGFDGVDINMGCPDKSIEKQGAGAAMIKDPETAYAVIAAAKKGFQGPVSVKTRVGYNKVDMSWIEGLLKQDLAALTIHARTRKEMSDVSAQWNLMPQIVALRDKLAPETLILGNGDVMSLEDARKKVAESGCDGAMIGRGIFGNPWFFSGRLVSDIPPAERLKVMLEHAKAFDKLLGDVKNFAIMKKHFKAYVSGWEGAKELRVKLMETNGLADVTKIVKDYLKVLK